MTEEAGEGIMFEPIKLDPLLESIFNVTENIKHYKESKKQCECCYKNKRYCVTCYYYIPSMISLEIMEKKQIEPWAEYNEKNKGKLRYDGTVI